MLHLCRLPINNAKKIGFIAKASKTVTAVKNKQTNKR